MVTVLFAENVFKAYGDTKALAGASLDLRQGEILGLLGPNGAGKTTLIKIFATLLRKDSGQVSIFGMDLDKDEAQIRHVLGYVGQDTERSAYARLTVRENLRFFASLRGLSKDEADDQMSQLADHFEFNSNLEKQFMHLSGGQKQAAVIMRALIHDPPMIFLDEPTKGLDPIIARRIRAFLMRYASEGGKSLLLTSHILSEVDEMADRVALIHRGAISAIASPDVLKEEVGVKEFIELKSENLSEGLIERILGLDSVVLRMDRSTGWVSFGVSDLFDGTEAILGLLKDENQKIGFRHQSVSLEDAFIRHVGALEEKFEK